MSSHGISLNNQKGRLLGGFMQKIHPQLEIWACLKIRCITSKSNGLLRYLLGDTQFLDASISKSGHRKQHPSSHSLDNGHNLISAHTAQLNFQVPWTTVVFSNGSTEGRTKWMTPKGSGGWIWTAPCVFHRNVQRSPCVPSLFRVFNSNLVGISKFTLWATENGDRNSGFTHQTWWFSIR